MSRTNEALLLLRVAFGLSMIAHGVNKIRGGLEGTQKWFDNIGMRRARVQAVVASTTEIGAGTLLIVGLFTAPACVAMISLMAVAIVTVHRKVGYFIFLPGGGWEYCAAIAAVAVSISLTGPGEWSLDNVLDTPLGSGIWALPVAVSLTVVHLSIFWRPPVSPTRS